MASMASRWILARRFSQEQEQRLESAQDTLRFLRTLTGERQFAAMAHRAVPLAMATKTVDELHLCSAMFTVWTESMTSEEMARALGVR